jgi:hypothetical protein
MMAAVQRESARALEGDRAATFLLGEGTVREGGDGPVVTLAEYQGRWLLLMLGITRVIDRQSLGVSIWGSADGIDWHSEPLLSLPRKYYCGSYETLLNLPNRPDVKYLRANWTVSRWAQDDRKPIFTFYISMRELARRDESLRRPPD